MSRQYNPKKFLRQIPNQLLKEYFDRRSLLTEILWYLQRENRIEKIYNAWQSLPDTQRANVDKDFQDVDEMACEAGVKAMIEEGHFHGIDLATQLGGLDGFHHKAMWVFLHHSHIFEVASLINYVDTHWGRSWVRWIDLPRKEPLHSADTREALGKLLSDYYRNNQGRGHRCTVETYLRGWRYHYYFAYLDDYTDTFIGHADDGKLIRRSQKRAFEVVFAYDPVDGVLDLIAKGEKQLKCDLQQIFGVLVLGERLKPELPRAAAYELNGLVDRGFTFATDPEDGIEEVRVRQLRLAVGGNFSRRITLEADPKGLPGDLYDLMDEFLAKQFMRTLVFQVTQVTLEFRFAVKGRKRPKALKFELTFPNGSSLKSMREEDRALAEKYLKRWGIDRA